MASNFRYFRSNARTTRRSQRNSAPWPREPTTWDIDHIWVSDHVILPREVSSFYPYAADGVATFRSRPALLRAAGRP